MARRGRRRWALRRRMLVPGQTSKVRILLLVTPPCRQGYRDVGYHIIGRLTCLLYSYRNPKCEVDDWKDEKDMGQYLVLAHFVGSGLDDVAGYSSE